MDNSDMRRGKPACHKHFDEGIAVLTGDALHTLAMQILASHPAPMKAEKRVRLIQVLSKACGPTGMAAGQALDITLMDSPSLSTDLLEQIYKLKTGALFTACIELGLLCSHEDNEIHHKALVEFGDCIGLAFQIQDDILDIEIESNSLGKPQGIDAKNKKITYPKLHGINKAKEKVEALYLSALESINYLGHQAQLLRALAAFMLERKK